jgi:N-methylhydantoinase B
LWDKPQWEESALEDLNQTFNQMTNEAISSAEVWAGKIRAKPLIERYIDIRYEGQAWELSIPMPKGQLEQTELAKLADDFREEYERTYGYRLNTPMRVANLRLVATIPSKRPSSTTVATTHAETATQETKRTRRAYWGKEHGFMDTPVVGLEQIRQEPISGPLLVDCYDTTIVIPPGCTATMGEWGNVIINIESEVATTKEPITSENKKIDMIILELINNFLYSLVDEMTQTVVRTSLSPITRDSFDFQCGFCRADGEMLLEGEGTLIHSLIYPTLISNWLKEHRDTTYTGDIIITNDPYSDAAHLPDVYMYQPIFIGNELVAWAVGGGHQRDVGGATPGSCACDATEIYQEGLRIPPMKLYEKGTRNEDLFTLIRAASRTPDIVEADIEAYRAACRTGEERFMELVSEYNWETLKIYFDELLDYAERLTRAEIKALPDGDYEFTDYIDDPGAGYLDAGGNIIADPVRIHLKLTIKGDSITYDFTGTAPQVKGAMNNPYGTSKATVMSCLRFMMNPDIPRNSGAFRPVTLIIPKGTLLNPVLPAAVASRAATFGRETDVMMGAEAQIVPNRLMASASNIDTLLNIGGYDEDGRHFILMEAMWGGWGGRPFDDGIDYNTPPELNGANQPCERNEELYPVLYTQYGYLPDREGAGKYRGSVAVVREYKLLTNEAILQLRVDRQRFGPYGLYGGMPGAPLEVILNPDVENLHIGKTTMALKQSDVVRIIFAGAGGWGNPLERDIGRVLNDVLDEKVSLQRAKEVYGVAIDQKTTAVDVAGTERLREAIKQKDVYS